jgi:hypothetical protein
MLADRRRGEEEGRMNSEDAQTFGDAFCRAFATGFLVAFVLTLALYYLA